MYTLQVDRETNTGLACPPHLFLGRQYLDALSQRQKYAEKFDVDPDSRFAHRVWTCCGWHKGG